jgi:hypothetical protein
MRNGIRTCGHVHFKPNKAMEAFETMDYLVLQN